MARITRRVCQVSVIVHYSSIEQASIEAILSQSSKFSDDVVVSYGSHLLDGSPEDLQHIHELSYKHPNVRFTRYEVDVDLDLSHQPGVVSRPTAYWHNLGRWTGTQHVRCEEWEFAAMIRKRSPAASCSSIERPFCQHSLIGVMLHLL